MKPFINPQIRIVLLNDNDLIVTSGIEEQSEVGGSGSHWDARQRRTSIWDDEF